MSLLKKIEAKRAQKLRAEKNKKAAIATLGAVAGTLAGTVAGVLIAPKSGKETIADVKEKSLQVKDKLADNYQGTKVKVTESKNKIKEYLEKRKAQKNDETQVKEEQPLLLENTEETKENEEA